MAEGQEIRQAFLHNDLAWQRFFKKVGVGQFFWPRKICGKKDLDGDLGYLAFRRLIGLQKRNFFGIEPSVLGSQSGSKIIL